MKTCTIQKPNPTKRDTNAIYFRHEHKQQKQREEGGEAAVPGSDIRRSAKLHFILNQTEKKTRNKN